MAYSRPFAKSEIRTAAKGAPLLPISRPHVTEFNERRLALDTREEPFHENLGLKTIYDPRRNGYTGEPAFDIVAVHGLLESPEHTWTWPSQLSDEAPDKYSLHRQQGISSFVRDVLSPLSDTVQRARLRHRTPKNKEQQEQDISTQNTKKARQKRKIPKVNWLTDPEMLPNSFPHARFMSFNYGWKQRSTTFEIRNDAAYRLLNALAEDREDTLRFPSRPIVFIGHSFGGIVIQTALVLAEQEKFIPYYPGNNDLMWQNKKEMRSEILNATVGVVFLATPFKITRSIRERWADIGVNLASDSKPSESRTMMQEQSGKSNAPNSKFNKVSDQFNLDFLETAREEKYRLACFYEKHQISSEGSSFLDEDSSTLPGYPKIPLMKNHTSMSKFPSENDQSYRVVVDSIQGMYDFAPTRQLWKAVSMGRIRTVQMMLDLGADPNLQDIEGEGAIHKAVRCEEDARRIMQLLLSRGANINLKDNEQNTALSIAESEAKDDIARFLRGNGATRRFWDMKKIGNEHPLDKIYMDGPGRSSNIQRKWGLEVLDSYCEDACRKSTLSINHFRQCATGTLNRYRSKVSVFDALYEENASKEIIGNALTKYQEVNGIKTESASFTWYHLPANNMAWVEKLFTIIFENWLAKDPAEASRSMRSLYGEQHRLNTSNFLYMRPDCSTVDLAFAARQQMAQHVQVGNQYVQNFIPLKYKQSFETEQKVALKLFMPYLHYEKCTTQVKMKKWVEQSTKSYNRQTIFKQKPCETTIVVSLSHQNTEITDSSRVPSNLQESDPEDEPGPASESSPELEGIFGEFISECMKDPPDPYLIRGYLNKEPLLHMRRSLDQFYYMSKKDDMIDYRGMNQVVYKYFDEKVPKKKSQSGSWETGTTMTQSLESVTSENVYLETKQGEAFKELLQKWEKESKTTVEHPIIMVDQLWLWVIDGDTIVTSFPQASEPSANGILERIEEKLAAFEINNIGDLTSLIIDECAGFLDPFRAPKNIAILDIYDETISDAMKQQVELFDRFTETVLISAVREEYHNLRRVGKHFEMEEELHLKYKEKASSILSEDVNQSPLSITQEAELLREIRAISDAKEELNSIKRILEQQDRVIDKGFRPVASRAEGNELVKKLNGGAWAATQAASLVECRHNHKRNAEKIYSTVQNNLRSVKAMLERADEVSDGLKTLLDLMQKEINAQEARATRQLAQGNEKQAKIILIFTIVTIVFMPLSFLASFFALNVDRFPRSVDGGVEFGLLWVAGLIFGVTAAFVVPFVIGAFLFVSASGREQTRNMLRHWFKIVTSSRFWLTVRVREHGSTKVSRRRLGTSLQAEGWDAVMYETPSFV